MDNTPYRRVTFVLPKLPIDREVNPTPQLFALALLASTFYSSVLERALECQAHDGAIDDALSGTAIPTDGTPTRLRVALQVFGYSVTNVAFFREGGEDVYTAILPAQSLSDVARRAHLTQQEDGSYQRIDGSRVLLAESVGDAIHLRCTTHFE